MITPSLFNGPLLETVLLRTFMEVVDSGSFVTAAEHLSLTPSAVSGHIKRLEQIADTTLLLRTTRRLTLTEAGKSLYPYAKRILDLEREARAKVQGAPLRGQIRIGASDDFATSWLPQVLQRFHQWHPDTTIELKVGITVELLRMQERGQLDLVFGKQCSRVETNGALLWEEPLHWVFSADHSLSLHAPLPLAVFPEPCVYRESAIAALDKSNHDWRIVFESSSMAGCLSAARSGFAVAIIADSQRSQDLRIVGTKEGLPRLPTARFYAFPTKRNPITDALVDAAWHVGQQNRFSAKALHS